MDYNFTYDFCYNQIINDFNGSKYSRLDTHRLAHLLYDTISIIPQHEIICFKGGCSPKINIENIKPPILKRQSAHDSHNTIIRTKCYKCNKDFDFVVFY